MASNQTTTSLRFIDQRYANGYMGLLLSACNSRYTSAHILSGPIFGLARGRTVSISRGSPPPKKR